MEGEKGDVGDAMESEKLLPEDEKADEAELGRAEGGGDLKARVKAGLQVILDQTYAIRNHHLLHTKRPHPRILYGTVLVLCATLLFYLSHNRFSTSNHGRQLSPPIDFGASNEIPPSIDLERPLRGDPLKAPSEQSIKPLYLHNPIQKTPEPEPEPLKARAPWLIVISSYVDDLQRRMLIRNTYISLFSKERSDTYEAVFIIGRPSPAWRPVIDQENATHGDIHILENIEASRWNTNTRKTADFFVDLLATTESSSPTYRGAPPEFVSKVDTKSYIYLSRFYNEFIYPYLYPELKEAELPPDKPSLPTPATNSTVGNAANSTSPPNQTSIEPPPPFNETTLTPSKLTKRNPQSDLVAHPNTLIGRRHAATRPDIVHPFPQGAFYTLTWPLVSAIAKRHKQNPVYGEHENVLIGRYLHEENIEYEFIDLFVENRQMDFGTDGDVQAHMVKEGRLLCGHELNEDKQWVALAEMYEEEGDVRILGREDEVGVTGEGNEMSQSFQYDTEKMDENLPLIELINPEGLMNMDNRVDDTLDKTLSRWHMKPGS